MTVLDGRLGAAADAPEPQQTGTFLVDFDRDVPARVEGTQLLGAQPGSGYKVAPLLVRRVDGQVMQVTPLLYDVLDAIDGRRTADDIATTVSVKAGRDLHPDDAQALIDQSLRPNGLVLGRDGSHPPLRKRAPLLALRAKFVVSKPEVTRRVTAPFALLFNPGLVVLMTVAFAAVSYW